MANTNPHHEMESSSSEELLSPIAAEALVSRKTELAGVLSGLVSPMHKAFEQLEPSLSATFAGSVTGLMSSWTRDLAQPNEGERPPIVNVAQSFNRSPLSGVFGVGGRVGGSVGGPLHDVARQLSGLEAAWDLGGSVTADRFQDIARPLSGLGAAWDLGDAVSGLSGGISGVLGVGRRISGLAQSFSLEALGVPEEVREFLRALRAYEEGDCTPLFEFARKHFGIKLDRRRRKRLQREASWFWDLSPGEGLVLLRHPERWLDEQAFGRRAAAIDRVLRKNASLTKALDALSLPGESRQELWWREIEELLCRKEAALHTDKELARFLEDDIRSRGRKEQKVPKGQSLLLPDGSPADDLLPETYDSSPGAPLSLLGLAGRESADVEAFLASDKLRQLVEHSERSRKTSLSKQEREAFTASGYMTNEEAAMVLGRPANQIAQEKLRAIKKLRRASGH